MTDDSRTLVARYRRGSEAAAEEIFRRYLDRLVALARVRLAREVARRVDPEDAVQSALRSFFLGARGGRFELAQSGDLWRVLASITAHKTSRLTARHRAAKRSVRRDVEFPASSSFGLDDAAVDPHPPPDAAALFADELADLVRTLTPELRRVLEFRLQDASLEVIAGQLGCSTRTVRRRLDELRAIIERRATTVEQDHTTPVPPDTPPLDYRAITIEAHLGTGGMGRVYRARRRDTGELVALKVLRKALLKRPAAVARFRREASIVASLDHPGIIRTHGFGRMPGGSEFFVLDLVGGGDLTAIERTTLDEQRIAAWLREAAAAVAYANARGIIHCDLKPSNLLLDAGDRIVVGDFGLAAAIDSRATPAGATLAFAAPELLCPSVGAVSAATDVWGLGAVLAWLLWGHAPWSATTVAELTARIERGVGPELPTAIESTQLRSTLAAICRRALGVDPKSRYANCEELAAALTTLLPWGEGGGVLADG